MYMIPQWKSIPNGTTSNALFPKLHPFHRKNTSCHRRHSTVPFTPPSPRVRHTRHTLDPPEPLPEGLAGFLRLEPAVKPFGNSLPKPCRTGKTAALAEVSGNPLQLHLGVAPSLGISQLGHHYIQASIQATSAGYGLQFGMEHPPSSIPLVPHGWNHRKQMPRVDSRIKFRR